MQTNQEAGRGVPTRGKKEIKEIERQ